MTTFKKCLLLGILLTTTSLSVPAAFYKWVDANGVTQYSQNPPPSGNYQEIRSPSPADHSNAEQQQAEASPAKQDSAATPVQAPPQDDQTQAEQRRAREQNCQLAQQRLSELENHPRIRYTDADGSVRVMSEEEKQAKLVETRKMAEKMCQ
jgi:Domain of unknown function (DUF4124)